MTKEKDSPVSEKNRAEWIFRLFAFALTGLQCAMLVLIFCLLLTGILLLVSPSAGPVTDDIGADMNLSVNIFDAYLILYLILPPLLAWFLAYPLPLKRKKQTWGMKLMGLKLYHPDQVTLKWNTVLAREHTKLVGLLLLIGIVGLVWILFDKEERTFFDRISGTYVIKDDPTLKIVAEFREHHKKSSG